MRKYRVISITLVLGPSGTDGLVSMVVQARAHASRQAILVAAAELFHERGLFNTTLSDVIDHAGVSKGKFIYHFPNREALAAALMDAADQMIVDTLRQSLSATDSALEGLIAGSFAVAELFGTDIVLRVGMQLRPGLGQSAVGTAEGMNARFATLTGVLTAAIDDGDIRADRDPAEVAYVVGVGLRGHFLQSAAAGVHPRAGLCALWRVILGEVGTADSHDRVQRCLAAFAE